MDLTAEQSAALRTLEDFALGIGAGARTTVATLSGFAGVGKTTVVAQLVEALKPTGKNVVLAAPTHKAVQVLESKLPADCGVDLMTVHALLGLRMVEQDGGGHDTKPSGLCTISEYDIAIIDEASMIDDGIFTIAMTNKINCRILFVGDPAQLNPVKTDKPSPAFGDIVPLHVTLSTVIRQAAEHPAIRFSVALREDVSLNRLPDLMRLYPLLDRPTDHQHVVITAGGDATIQQWMADAIQRGQDARILAFTNDACLRHNAAIHRAIYPDCSDGYAVGEQVIAQESFTIKVPGRIFPYSVRTSDLVTIRAKESGQHPKFPSVAAWHLIVETERGIVGTCWIPQDRLTLDMLISGTFAAWSAKKAEMQRATGKGRERLSFEAKDLSSRAWDMRKSFANIRHSYALTIHKSQGSTFDTVLIDWNSLTCSRNPGDAARLAYVAITRPSKYLVIVV